MRNHLLLLALTTLLVPVALSAAPHAKLSPGFKPYQSPYIQQAVNPKVYLNERFRRCGSSFTTRDPSFTFELTAAMTDINLDFFSKSDFKVIGALVVTPTGAYGCSKQGNIYLRKAEAGTYKIFLFTSSRAVSTYVRIEQPDKHKAAAVAHLKHVITRSKLNPNFIRIAPGPVSRAWMAGMKCVNYRTRIAPLGTLQITEPGKYYISYPGLWIQNTAGRCQRDIGSVRNNTLYSSVYALKAGTYRLWVATSIGAKPGPATLQMDNRDQPYHFAKAPTKDVAKLPQPLLMSGKTKKPQKWGNRVATCRGAARAPDFYFKASEAGSVLVESFRNRYRHKLHVFGPIEGATAGSMARCDKMSHTIGKAQGTYAVWVRSKKAGLPYHVVLRNAVRAPDPLTVLVPIPSNPSVKARNIRRHYPYFAKHHVEQLFLKAPLQLLVFAKTGFTEGKDAVLAGEPLLLDGKKAVRFNGRQVNANLSNLSTTRPAALGLPTKAPFVPAKDYWDAVLQRRAEDQPLVAKVEAKTEKYRGCVVIYMRKHDPSWGKRYELVWTSGRRAGENVSTTHFRAAARRCGEKRLMGFEKKTKRKLDSNRRKRESRQLEAVRQRLN